MLIYKGKNKKYINAVEKANQLFGNQRFYMFIKAAAPFDMSDITNEKLVDLIEKNKHIDIEVKVAYKWWNPYWRLKITHGMFNNKKPNQFEINGYIRKTEAQLVGVMWHELLHALDYMHPQYSFNHGSNDPKGKENTTQYYIGRLAKRLTEKS